jgi:hypothetical protein
MDQTTDDLSKRKKTEIIKVETDGSRKKIDNRSDLFSFTNIARKRLPTENVILMIN